MQADQWIAHLNLEPHSEGGYFRQTYKSDQIVTLADGRVRALSTSILFLLTPESPSHFHRLQSDEIWYYHSGAALTVHMLTPEGAYETVRIGAGPGELLSYTVPKGTIFGSSIDSQSTEDFAVVSCVVSPAFEYDDFELFTQAQLLADYPEHEAIIKRLAYEHLD